MEFSLQLYYVDFSAEVGNVIPSSSKKILFATSVWLIIYRNKNDI